MARNATILATLSALALVGCAETDPILPGERLNVHDVLETRADPLADNSRIRDTCSTIATTFAPNLATSASWS